MMTTPPDQLSLKGGWGNDGSIQVCGLNKKVDIHGKPVAE